MGTERRRSLPAGYEAQIGAKEIGGVFQKMDGIFDSVISTNSVGGWPEPAQQTLRPVIVDLLVALHYGTNGRWRNVHARVESTETRIDTKTVRGSEMHIIVGGESEGLLKTPASLTDHKISPANATKGARHTLVQALNILQNGVSPTAEPQSKQERGQNSIKPGAQRSTRSLGTWHRRDLRNQI